MGEELNDYGLAIANALFDEGWATIAGDMTMCPAHEVAETVVKRFVAPLLEEAARLRAESANRLEVGDRLGWRLVEAEQENKRLRREVEFEANATDPGREGGYSRDNIRFPLCSCFTAEQLAALDLTRWARPQCAVHPDGGE